MLRNAWRVSLALLALTVCCTELHSAPPDSPRPRGERLRAIAERLRENAQASEAQAEADATEGEQTEADGAGAIDFAALNEVLAEALKGFAQIEPAFEQLELQFDTTATNWEADQLALQVQATLAQTAWSESPTSLALSLQADIDPASASQPARGMVRVEFRLQTDVPPLLAHVQQRLARPQAPRLRLRPFRQQPAEPQDPGPLAEIRAAAAAAGPLDSLDAAADLLLGHSGQKLTAANGAIDEIKAKLVAATESAEQRRLAEELAAARAERDKLLALRLSIERDELGVAQRLTVERASAPPGDEPLQLAALELQITNSEIVCQAEVQLQRGVEGYLLFKPLLTGLLQNLQRDDPAAKAQLLSLLGVYWTQMRSDVLEPGVVQSAPESESAPQSPDADTAPLDDPFGE